ncbi:HAD-IA family hydrolase [Nocardioides dongxiaopingii]|uniref:HAD-IA family hydrolase n=1 Tax=Nocardioides TaxID=1839 RepID=UPI0010C7659F|nr:MULTISPECIES: HAD-IA family hydrolase [Nocardioides]QCW50881.1 HAD-IA family hydrolase [Nocardioides sp. S-1144]
MTAILFGSISTLADTSEIQRDAFNRAFAEHGIDWQWDREEYAGLLASSGGRDRVAAYAEERGEDVDADAVHATKSRIYQETLAATEIAPREGVVETIRAAREQGFQVGLVTTTSADNLAALGTALADSVAFDEFDVVVDVSKVGARKPDAEAYSYALAQLGADAGDAVAIEDNLGGVASAQAAGVAVVAFPNGNTVTHDFGSTRRVEALDLADLRS